MSIKFCYFIRPLPETLPFLTLLSSPRQFQSFSFRCVLLISKFLCSTQQIFIKGSMTLYSNFQWPYPSINITNTYVQNKFTHSLINSSVSQTCHVLCLIAGLHISSLSPRDNHLFFFRVLTFFTDQIRQDLFQEIISLLGYSMYKSIYSIEYIQSVIYSSLYTSNHKALYLNSVKPTTEVAWVLAYISEWSSSLSVVFICNIQNLAQCLEYSRNLIHCPFNELFLRIYYKLQTL